MPFYRTVKSFPSELTVQDGSQLDPFGRLRVSAGQQHLLSSEMNYDLLPLLWETVTNGAGSNVAHVANESAATLTCDQNNGDYCIRQTYEYYLYRAGIGRKVELTFTGMGGETGFTKRVGYFDDNNGVYFEVDGSGNPSVVVRTNTSGSPVNNSVAQASWNVDRFDGSGPSGVTLDVTKAQILFIDLQWLGAGRVRIGFNVDGRNYIAHEFKHANSESTVYMTTGSLPVRYEIRCSGASAAGTMKQICSSVSNEGADANPSTLSSVSVGPGGTSISTTAQSFLSLRLRSTHIRASVKVESVSMTVVGGNADVLGILVLDPTLADSLSWSNAGQATQSSVTQSNYTAGTGHTMASFITSGTNSTAIIPVDGVPLLTADHGGTSKILSLVLDAASGTPSMAATINYRENF